MCFFFFGESRSLSRRESALRQKSLLPFIQESSVRERERERERFAFQKSSSSSSFILVMNDGSFSTPPSSEERDTDLGFENGAWCVWSRTEEEEVGCGELRLLVWSADSAAERDLERVAPAHAQLAAHDLHISRENPL